MPPIKSQRTVTKEKYSPKNKTSLRDVSSSGAKVIQPAKNVKKTTSSTNGNLCKYLKIPITGLLLIVFISIN